MTTEELLVALTHEYPNGVSFDPMAVRLLRQKLPLEEGQIEELKAAMFQLGNGLWFSREMVADGETHAAVRGQATKWLTEHGCFSVERLLECFCRVLRHIASPQQGSAFLRHLDFTVAARSKSGLLCFQKADSAWQQACLSDVAHAIAKRLEAAGGTLALHEIEEAVPYLTAGALEGIRVHFLPEIHAADIGGVPCWRSAEAITLPEGFSDKITAVVEKLRRLGRELSCDNLLFALDWEYECRFMEEHALVDRNVFWRICQKSFKGQWPDAVSERVKSDTTCGARLHSAVGQGLATSTVEALAAASRVVEPKVDALALAALDAARMNLTNREFRDLLRVSHFPAGKTQSGAALAAAKAGKTVEQIAVVIQNANEYNRKFAREYSKRLRSGGPRR